MNTTKIGNLLAYISSNVKDVNLRKLIKLVYLIDEESVCTRGLAVTWLTYYAWEKGPVAPCIYEIKEGGKGFSQYIHVHRNSENKVIITPAIQKTECALQFSKKELKLIDAVLNKYGKLSADELSEITHKPGGLWNMIVMKYHPLFLDGRSDIKLNMADLIKGDEEKTGVFQDAYEIAMMC